MLFKKIKCVEYWSCPVCGENSTNREEIEQHFRKHQLKRESYIYCNICGTGWSVTRYGKERAMHDAEQRYQSHIDSGDADAIARRTYFYSNRFLSYAKSIEGGKTK